MGVLLRLMCAAIMRVCSLSIGGWRRVQVGEGKRWQLLDSKSSVQFAGQGREGWRWVVFR